MWLDRFSNQPTPNGSPPPAQNRSFSPAPRRVNHLTPGPAPRPGFSPRSSSLLLVSKANSSSTSLLGTTRITNGSALKQEITPPPNIPDPLDVLEKIIGSQTVQAKTRADFVEESTIAERPKELIADIDFNGLSLEALGSMSDEPNGVAFQQYNARPVEEYEKEKDKFEDLHQSILACDDVLKSVESSLTSFQKDLGLVSAEIETLQSRSTAMNTRLENRQVVEKLLGPAVEDISISPSTVRTISESPIDETWLKALIDLEKRSEVISAKAKGPNIIRAVTDIKPLLDNLISKAVERIRDFLVSQIKALRSPNINAQVIQQQKLSKYRDLYRFLAKQNPQLAEEIGQAYINTMRWYYLNNFTRYRQALDKMSRYNVDKYDALGGDQSSQRTNKTAGAKVGQTSHDAFSIGRRADVLKASNQPAVSSYLAEEDKSTHYIENPFHNFNLAVIDNVSFEYSFLTEFFSANSFHQMSRRFAEIFEPTFALGQSVTKELVETTHDCLGILLCVRLNQRLAFELQRRKVPVAENYINGTNIILWPRFQQVMDFHCESVRHFAMNLSGLSAAYKLTFGAALPDASKQSTAPHYLTQRFGQFLYGILAISHEAGDDEPMSSSLGRLRGEYEAFLLKASKVAGGDGPKRERFLGNNYALILTIIADTEGKLAQEQKKHFEDLKARLGEQR